jgi:hypothetical protein
MSEEHAQSLGLRECLKCSPQNGKLVTVKLTADKKPVDEVAKEIRFLKGAIKEGQSSIEMLSFIGRPADEIEEVRSEIAKMEARLAELKQR